MKKLVFYGAGKVAEEWLNKLGNESVYCLADSNPDLVGKIRYGKEIKNIEELKSIKEEIDIFISVSDKYKRDIYELLRSNGLEQNVIANPYEENILYADESVSCDANTWFEGKNYLGPNVSMNRCRLGYASYIAGNTELYAVEIGKYCCVAQNLRVIRGQHPTSTFVSVHPAFYSPDNQVSRVKYVDKCLYDEYRIAQEGCIVKIGNDVWIGSDVSIMEGVRIGDGAIIAAGALVTKEVLPYSVVGGVPAKEIKKRFEKEEIDFLLELQWWNRSEDWIKEKAKFFYDIKMLKENVLLTI